LALGEAAYGRVAAEFTTRPVRELERLYVSLAGRRAMTATRRP